MLAGRETLMMGLGWKLGSGEKIKIWNDRWLPSLHNFQLSSPVSSADWEGYLIAKKALDKDVVPKASSSFVVPRELWKAIWCLKVAEKMEEQRWCGLEACFVLDGTDLRQDVEGCLKHEELEINCDASFLPESGSTGLGVMVRDCYMGRKCVNGKDLKWDWRCSEIVREILLLCGERFGIG
ncbi:ribonuclease H [Senna tora]|uniref:Ribonuclease H n=1 Tax=Senna tora TaxID=362788 RepID=A0A834T455_9FABA|nr:ribonuclease H [Senna tora]